MHNNLSQYTFGDIVYIKTDQDQNKIMVTELRFSQGQCLYTVSNNGMNSECYNYELTDKADENTKLGL